MQIDACRELLAGLPQPEVREAWNTAFGPGSLFEAWTSTTLATGVYAANVALLRELMDARPDWRVIEVGAGNGALWRRLLKPEDQGEIVAIDPVPGALDELARHVPEDVRVDKRVARVEALGALPPADAVVCSLTLHHVAGRDAAERAAHGLTGPGKVEVLRAFGDAARARQGRVILCEADIHCEVDLPSGSHILRERLFDSYVRRSARAILDDLDQRQADADLQARWRHILRHWSLEQVAMAERPVAERDVYELDVGRWLEVLDRAGLQVSSYRPTDAFGLFWQYVAAPR